AEAPRLLAGADPKEFTRTLGRKAMVPVGGPRPVARKPLACHRLGPGGIRIQCGRHRAIATVRRRAQADFPPFCYPARGGADRTRLRTKPSINPTGAVALFVAATVVIAIVRRRRFGRPLRRRHMR